MRETEWLSGETGKTQTSSHKHAVLRDVFILHEEHHEGKLHSLSYRYAINVSRGFISLGLFFIDWKSMFTTEVKLAVKFHIKCSLEHYSSLFVRIFRDIIRF